jgi:hypothetical protein
MSIIDTFAKLKEFVECSKKQNIPTLIFLNKLSEFKLEHHADIMDLLVELLLLNLEKDLKEYVLKTVPLPYEKYEESCIKLGYDVEYLKYIFYGKSPKQKEKKVYAPYPTWTTHEKMDVKNIKEDHVSSNDKPDYDTTENMEIDDAVEEIEDIAKNMICYNPGEFQIRGPKNDEYDFWYTGKCDRCDLYIRDIKHSIRYPVKNGGWRGCFCGMLCMIHSDHITDEYEQTRFEMMFSQLEIYGILDPIKNIDINENKIIELKKTKIDKNVEEKIDDEKIIETGKIRNFDDKIKNFIKEPKVKFVL